MKRIDWLIFTVAILAYVALTWPLNSWIIDDAGISFSYARTLADGYGLTSQPGAPPVEGYSNFLWVILMSLSFLLGIFNPFVTPKLIAVGLTGITLYLVSRIVGQHTCGSRYSIVAALFLVVFNTSFIIWSCSGLENPLFATLVVALTWICLDWQHDHNYDLRRALLSGGCVFLLALTRPDGIAYFALPVLAMLLRYSNRSLPAEVMRFLTTLGIYLASAVIPFSVSLLFRETYYGQALPNTYYAKSGPRLVDLGRALTFNQPYLDRFRELYDSVFGTGTGIWLALVVLVMVVVLIARQRQIKILILLMAGLAIATLVYMLMPNDWMGEFRFATAFFALGSILVAVSLTLFLREVVSRNSVRRFILVLVLLLMGAATLKEQVARLTAFYRNPVVSFENIANRFGRGFNAYADSLGIDSGSVLLPDLGGALYYSRLRVYDLTGLCDQTIARTMRSNKSVFYDYVFDDVRPTFIHIHGNWTFAARFDLDPRFQRDYTPIRSYEDKWVEKATGLRLISGDFVRKDALERK